MGPCCVHACRCPLLGSLLIMQAILACCRRLPGHMATALNPHQVRRGTARTASLLLTSHPNRQLSQLEVSPVRGRARVPLLLAHQKQLMAVESTMAGVGSQTASARG